MPYIGRSTDGFGVRNRFLYLASASDTSVSGADANGATLTFTDGAYVDVYLNGVLLKAGTDYNTNTANTIASLAAMAANDEVTVVVYDIFTTADMVSATSGGTFSGNVTMGGTLGVTGATTTAAITASGVVDITNTTDASDDSGDTGALRVEGGASIAKKLYVGTDLDVDGTANLDVVDIDGAVDMASSLTVGGAFTSLGIDDNANATAITINSAEQVLIGDATTPASEAVVRIAGTGATDKSPFIEFANTNNGPNNDDTMGGFLSLSGTDSVAEITVRRESSSSNAYLFFGTQPNGGSLTERMRITSDGDVNVKTGNLIIGTSGKGIDFSATGDGTGANQAEVLDDYEEGTWTPTLPSGGTVDTISAATFTKIGKIVHIGFYIAMSSIPNNASAFYIGGLPYVIAYDGSSGEHYHGAGAITYVGSHNIASFGMLPPTPWTNNDDLYFHRGDGNNSTVTNANMTGCPYFICSTVYVTNS